MILWVCFAILTAGVIGAILVPLTRETLRQDSGDAALDANASDLAVYREQLSEIEVDRERGLIDAQAAQGARAELARRIFSHTEKNKQSLSGPEKNAAGDGKSKPTGSDPQANLIYVLAAIIPLASTALYLAVGSPGLPGKPHVAKEQKTTAQSDVEKLIMQVEARLRDKPQDGRGWDVLAPVYFRLQQYEDARIAYRQAVLLLGPTKQRLAGLGLSEVRANDGTITPRAREAFEQQLTMDPSNIESRLWLARASEQDGDIAGAIKGYQDLLKHAPSDATWSATIQQRITTLRGRGSASDTASNNLQDGKPNESASRATPSNMTPEQRAKFISKMVEGLAERLKTDGSNFDDWVKLVRSYAVLGRVNDAKKVIADARVKFSGDEVKARTLKDLEQQYGLGS